jgi:hypothetical protein
MFNFTVFPRLLRRLGFILLATITTFTLLFVNQSQVQAAQQRAFHQAATALIQHPLQIDTSQVTAKLQPAREIARNGRFQVAYAPVENERYRELREAVQSAGLYESIAGLLNKLFILPTNITITPASCGQANAFYSPKDQQIVMCDEMLGHLAVLFADSSKSIEDLAESMINTNMFIFFHELGHGLIDIYDLPTVGREEDAVDEFSTLLLLEADDYGEKAVLSAAHWFVLQSQSQAADTPFWDEHALDMQRFFKPGQVYGFSREWYFAGIPCPPLSSGI